MKISEALAAQREDPYDDEVSRILEAKTREAAIVAGAKGPPPEALRYNDGKPDLEQVMWFDLSYLAEHCAVGRTKYPDRGGKPNWTLGGKPDSEYVNSMLRHIAAFVQGEELDSETSTHHMAAVAWNALALLTNNRKADA